MRRAVILALSVATFLVPARGSEYSEHPRLPDDMRDLAQKATDDFKAQRYDAATADYRQIIAKYPDSFYAWSNLGVVRSQQGHLEEANDAFDRVLQLQPHDTFTLVDSGLVCVQMNRYDKARARLEEAVRIEPENSTAHSFLGAIYQHLGLHKKATEEFRKAREAQNDRIFRLPVDRMYPPISDLPDGR
jgi:tetratricopeptide (TPR) repeat protein